MVEPQPKEKKPRILHKRDGLNQIHYLLIAEQKKIKHDNNQEKYYIAYKQFGYIFPGNPKHAKRIFGFHGAFIEDYLKNLTLA